MRPSSSTMMPIRVHDGGQPVGNDQRGLASLAALQGGEYVALGAGVHGGQRIVEDQYRRIFQQRAGQRQPLPLSTGQGHTPLSDLSFEAVGEAFDGGADSRLFAGFQDVLLRRVRATDRQIFADAAGIQERILQHDADLSTQPLSVERVDVVSVEPDRTPASTDTAQQHPDQARFAGSRRADDRQRFTRSDVNAEILQAPVVGSVAEGQMLD